MPLNVLFPEVDMIDRQWQENMRCWRAILMAQCTFSHLELGSWLMVMTEESLHSSSIIYLLAAYTTTEESCTYTAGVALEPHAPWHAPTCRWAERPRDKHANSQGAGMHPLYVRLSDQNERLTRWVNGQPWEYMMSFNHGLTTFGFFNFIPGETTRIKFK
jgi:hypothetical protein